MVSLDRADDEFVIMRPATDNEKYKILIHDIALYIPIAQLSQSVYDEYNSLLTRTIDSKANVVNIHYRRYLN